MKAGDDPGSVARPTLYLLVGPLAWAGHLFLVYAIQSVLCAMRLTAATAVDPLLIRATVLAATVLAAAALLLAIWRPEKVARFFRAAEYVRSDNGDFIVALMRMLAALSLAGVLWAGAAALLLEACPQLR